MSRHAPPPDAETRYPARVGRRRPASSALATQPFKAGAGPHPSANDYIPNRRERTLINEKGQGDTRLREEGEKKGGARACPNQAYPR